MEGGWEVESGSGKWEEAEEEGGGRRREVGGGGRCEEGGGRREVGGEGGGEVGDGRCGIGKSRHSHESRFEISILIGSKRSGHVRAWGTDHLSV